MCRIALHINNKSTVRGYDAKLYIMISFGYFLLDSDHGDNMATQKTEIENDHLCYGPFSVFDCPESSRSRTSFCCRYESNRSNNDGVAFWIWFESPCSHNSSLAQKQKPKQQHGKRKTIETMSNSIFRQPQRGDLTNKLFSFRSRLPLSRKSTLPTCSVLLLPPLLSLRIPSLFPP